VTVYRKKLLVVLFVMMNLLLAYAEVVLVANYVLIWQLATVMAAFHLVPAALVLPMLKRAAETPDPVAPPAWDVEDTSPPAPQAPVVEEPPPAPVVAEPPAPVKEPSPREAMWASVVSAAEAERRRHEDEEKARFDAETRAERPAVEAWLATAFAEIVKEKTINYVSYACLNPPDTTWAHSVRWHVLQLLRLPQDVYGRSDRCQDRRLWLHHFMCARGRALIEALLEDGFRLSVDDRPFTSYDDFRAKSGKGSELIVAWAHLVRPA
jgi:hypothetical protein